MATPFGQFESFGQAFGSTKSKSVRPKNVNKNIKVSQSEINTIKKMGMSKALASAGSASASIQEGIRRLYGERRYQAATYKPTNVVMGTPTSGYAPKKPMGTPTAGYAPKKTTYQTGENSRAVKKTVAKPKSKNVAGFKPNSIGAKAISSFRKAYSPQSAKKSK
jgi:hypothetical protein